MPLGGQGRAGSGPHPPQCCSSALLTCPLGVPTADERSGKDSEAWVPDSEERLILREEFTSRMHQRFLDGKDGDFDYRCSGVPGLPDPLVSQISQATWLL